MIDDPAVSAALSTLLVTIAGAAVVFIRQYIKARFSPQQLAAVGNMASLVVEASEVLGKDQTVNSADKYHIAEQALLDLAKRVGLKLSGAEVNALIHAALGVQRANESDGMNPELLAAAYDQGWVDSSNQELVPEWSGPDQPAPKVPVAKAADADLTGSPLSVVQDDD